MKMIIRKVDEEGWIEVNDKDLVKLDENGDPQFYLCDKNWTVMVRKASPEDIK